MLADRGLFKDRVETKSTILPGKEFYKKQFKIGAQEIYRRHFAQTKDDVARLINKYKTPAFGEIDTMRCFEQLALCVDPTDRTLIHTNQLVHTLQVLEGMEQDGVTDPDLLFAAAVHDLGKVLLLTSEAPENIVCGNVPIGDYKPKIGLANVTFQWNHDEFIYDRLKAYVPDQVAWLIRYHSVSFEKTKPYMDERDLTYHEKYLTTFRRYDQGTKSTTHLPRKRITDYSNLIARYLPKTIVI